MLSHDTYKKEKGHGYPQLTNSWKLSYGMMTDAYS